MSRRAKVKNPEEEVTLKGKIGAFGSGVEGSSRTTEINVKEYEEILHSMREALELYPKLPSDESVLKNASRVFTKLSTQGRKDLHFIMTGEIELPVKKYSSGTDARWVVPFVDALLTSYEATIREANVPWMGKIPYFRGGPIGKVVVLSEYGGLRIFFIKRSNGYHFMTTNEPFYRKLTVPGQISMVFNGGNHGRIKPAEDYADYIWMLHCPDEKEERFTIDRGLIDGRNYANEDILAYK